MIPRYSRDEMGNIWSDENRYKAWLEVEILTNGTREWVEAAFTVEKDIEKLGDAMIARIEEKRAALGI